jgi:chromosome segregation ATPase
MGGDIGSQILNAVQGLGVRMDRMEAQLTDLRTEVMDLKTQVADLRTEVMDLKTQVADLDSRMVRQEKLTDSLRAELERQWAEFLTWREGLHGEFHQLREEFQQLRGEFESLREDFKQMLADMQEGFRRLNAQDERTAGAVVMMASVLRRPTDLGEDLEKRLRELQPH